jgi:uncharacterized protein YndB with AHSA1/START domain
MHTQTHTMTLTRVLPASAEQVWAAWNTSEGIRQWWGPAGFTCPLANVDFREGGTTLVCMRAPAEFGGMDMYNTWTYTHIEPHARLEFVNRFSDAEGNSLDPAQMGLPPGIPKEVPHTILFKALGPNQTELSVTEFGYATPEAAELSKSGMVECLDKMEALFT